MSEVTIYAFETEGDEVATEWTTFDIDEARAFAKEHGYSLIARTFVYDDSELIEDYRPEHALDGTPLDDDAEGRANLMTKHYGITFADHDNTLRAVKTEIRAQQERGAMPSIKRAVAAVRGIAFVPWTRED